MKLFNRKKKLKFYKKIILRLVNLEQITKISFDFNDIKFIELLYKSEEEYNEIKTKIDELINTLQLLKGQVNRYQPINFDGIDFNLVDFD